MEKIGNRLIGTFCGVALCSGVMAIHSYINIPAPNDVPEMTIQQNKAISRVCLLDAVGSDILDVRPGERVTFVIDGDSFQRCKDAKNRANHEKTISNKFSTVQLFGGVAVLTLVLGVGGFLRDRRVGANNNHPSI